MPDSVNRRQFVKKSLLGCAGLASAWSLEEKALLASTAGEASSSPNRARSEPNVLPRGRIGKVELSRIICGGNLIGGFAHSRDLIYVSQLLKQYFTEEKIFETLEICEENGIDTIITAPKSGSLLNKYWSERGGKIQWLAQCGASLDDVTGSVREAVENGAVGAFLIGNDADKWCREGKLDLVGRFVDYAKEQGVIGGVAGHNLGTPMACEKAGIACDFYMKTHHSTGYWSKRRPGQDLDVIDNYATDNYWDKEPEKTVEFMRRVEKPWIAYKVLAAGAIHPRKGFQHAFENGADFLCVGMFDFQVVEDAIIARRILSGKLRRERPWRA